MEHTMQHDIEWINTTEPTVDYSAQAVAEYDLGQGSRIDEYTLRFEQEFNVSEGDDIGGLIVYSDSCVYDYENFCGWVRS
jgi:Mg2+/Co2+ transporter CorC